MPNGLDLLLAPQQAASGPQNGLDVLLAPPVQQQPQQAAQPAKAPSGFGQGLRDVWDAAAQIPYNLMPKGVQNATNAFDQWMYEKTGGATGIAPGQTFNTTVYDRNKDYEQQRAAAGESGVDWSRVGGNATAQTILSLLLRSPTTAGGAGFMGGMLTPVTDMSPEKDDFAHFGIEKSKQAATGWAVGKLLGAAGNSLMNVVSPQLAKGAKFLSDQGISLTPGQAMGGYLKSLEDKLTSFPVLGNAINEARGKGIEDLNRAAYQRVLGPLEEAGFSAKMPERVGREGVASITDAVKGAYNSVVPKLKLVVDDQLASEMASLRDMAAKGLPPAQLNEFNRVMKNVVDPNIVNGQSSGKFLQGMLEDLSSKASGYSADASFAERQLGDALKTVEQQLRTALERSNPEFAAQLSGINKAFANLARIQSAAQSAGAKEGVFSADQLAAAVRGGDDTARNNAYAQGKALMQDLSDPAKSVLPSSIPNSGTADRFNIANPQAWLGAAGALAYSPGVQQLAQKTLTGARPAAVKAMVDMLRKSAPVTTQPITAETVNALASYLKNRDAVQ